VDRKITYNSFVTIVRQICRLNDVVFTSQIRYNESKYNIDYFVYHEGVDVAAKLLEYYIKEKEDVERLALLKNRQTIEEVLDEIVEYVIVENGEEEDEKDL
jgi:hypothetical protein